MIGKTFSAATKTKQKHKKSGCMKIIRQRNPCAGLKVYTPDSFLFSEPCDFWSSLVLESV